MKRFDYDEDDEDFLPDTDDEGLSEADLEMMQRQEAMNMMQLDLVQLDLNQRLLFRAIKLVKKNTWFFGWRSKTKQLELVATAYHFLKKLTENNET